MKLNKNKISVSALALAIGTSLAGSISGTVAWYQYSTRANASFIGKASGISANLQMRLGSEFDDDDAWRTRITWKEMATELGTLNMMPMTFGKLDKDAALPNDGATTPAPLGYVQPVAGIADMSKWGRATNKNYAQFQLQLRNVDHSGASDANVSDEVYLSKMVIQEDVSNPTGKEDLSDAVRVHISASNGGATKLISNNGQTTVTKGELDLDGDGNPDKVYPDEFGFADPGDN